MNWIIKQNFILPILSILANLIVFQGLSVDNKLQSAWSADGTRKISFIEQM
jgi:hypothetical protein